MQKNSIPSRRTNERPSRSFMKQKSGRIERRSRTRLRRRDELGLKVPLQLTGRNFSNIDILHMRNRKGGKRRIVEFRCRRIMELILSNELNRSGFNIDSCFLFRFSHNCIDSLFSIFNFSSW